MSLALVRNPLRIEPMSEAAIDKARELETELLKTKQHAIQTEHTFFAGTYTRTAHIPAGTVVTGALIKIDTVLIVSGHATVYTGDDSIELIGYNVVQASAGRKQAFVAHADTALTMIFASQAETIEQAEAEFTDETHLLLSRNQSGEPLCLE